MMSHCALWMDDLSDSADAAAGAAGWDVTAFLRFFFSLLSKRFNYFLS